MQEKVFGLSGVFGCFLNIWKQKRLGNDDISKKNLQIQTGLYGSTKNTGLDAQNDDKAMFSANCRKIPCEFLKNAIYSV